jgi:AcrR family transcriptional regulator
MSAEADTTATAPHRGRPRDPARDLALQEAALELLASEGYERLSMELVAQRAGASKATIYRRWSSKVELVIDALALVKPAVDSVDTGSLEGDLDALAAASCSKRGAFATAVMCGVASSLGRDAELLTAFRERFTDPRVRRVREVLVRARERGELAGDVDIELAAELVPSLMLQRALMTGRAVGRDHMERIVDSVLRPMLGLAPRTASNDPNRPSTTRETSR